MWKPMNKVVNQAYLFFFSLVFFFLFLIQLNITIINLVMNILTKTKKVSFKKKTTGWNRKAWKGLQSHYQKIYLSLQEKREKNIDSVHETQIKPYRPARSQAMCSSEKDTLLLLFLHLSQSKFQRVLKYCQKALSNGWSAISYIPCVHVVLDIKAHSVLGHWPKWSHEPHSYHWSQKTTPYLPVMITSTQFVDMSVTTTDKPFSREHLPRRRDYMIKWYSQVKGINP